LSLALRKDRREGPGLQIILDPVVGRLADQDLVLRRVLLDALCRVDAVTYGRKLQAFLGANPSQDRFPVVNADAKIQMCLRRKLGVQSGNGIAYGKGGSYRIADEQALRYAARLYDIAEIERTKEAVALDLANLFVAEFKIT